MYLVRNIYKILLRLLICGKNWRYAGKGYCYSCNKHTIFLYSYKTEEYLNRLFSVWKLSEQAQSTLKQMENNLCNNCAANARMRTLAKSVVTVLGLNTTEDFANKLKSDSNFIVYETAEYFTFRFKGIRNLQNYVVSEYFAERPFGKVVDGIRNENLECLSFPDNFADVIMTSEVLEHVVNLDQALSEIQRVLKPGGHHIFTVPVDQNLIHTYERAKQVNGKIEHISEPVRHGDSIRSEGILAFREFGQDTARYISREGIPCHEIKQPVNAMVAAIYVAKKK